MEKRLIAASFLIVAFVFLWTWLFPPPRPVQPPTSSPTAGQAPGTSGGAGSAAPGEGTTPPAASPAGDEKSGGAIARPAILPAEKVTGQAAEEITIDTDLQTLRLTSRGARVVSWKLKKYMDDAGKPLELVSDAAKDLDRMPLQFELEDAEISRRIRDGIFHVTRRELTEGGVRSTEVAFAFNDGAGAVASKILRVTEGSYLCDLEVAAEISGRPVSPTIVWGAGFGPNNGLETGRFDLGADAVVNVLGRAQIEHRSSHQIKPQTPWLDGGAIAWAGIEDRYFAAILVPPSPAEGRTRTEALPLIREGRENFFLTFALQMPGVTKFRLFVGPKEYNLLKSLDMGLDGLLDWGFFRIIAQPLFAVLKVVQRYTRNFGWAIIVLTVCIRLLFFPFMHTSQLKMRRMQEKMKKVQPKVKAMKERYRKLEKKEIEKGAPGGRQRVRQQMNEEMMAIYKEAGINPLGSMSGCLPLLVQMPILYAFYKILTIPIELRKAPFVLWIHDLSSKDPYYVTPIVMGVTMLVQQMMTSASIPDPAQRRMMFLMPIMFTYFFVNLPSGLVLYWLVNNLLGIVQQYLVNKEAAAETAAA